MKSIFRIFLFSLMVFSGIKCKAQQLINPDWQSFIGTWEHVDGNQIFQVEIFKYVYEGDDLLLGHYRLLEDQSGNRTVIYDSAYELHGGAFVNPFSIYASTESATYMHAQISDHFFVNGLPTSLSGRRLTLDFTIIPNSCSTCPAQAQWTVEELQETGIRLSSQPTGISIPTDLILTKVN